MPRASPLLLFLTRPNDAIWQPNTRGNLDVLFGSWHLSVPFNSHNCEHCSDITADLASVSMAQTPALLAALTLAEAMCPATGPSLTPPSLRLDRPLTPDGNRMAVLVSHGTRFLGNTVLDQDLHLGLEHYD
ncbi:hypothetical protein B0H17DRAFT_1211430 [Mycena rosella]|uniref:Uncharacterized protein n=1 Tax=Mycena rosella TaxID=1033263 RepID=A0AAD7CUB2_MYCRO|nr:hypothetical protein B0H17DRAFT_1211430 [Mycena rosella]